MNTLNAPLGRLFVLLAVGNLLGLTRRFGAVIYPGNPSVVQRAAAPIIFAIIAAACFRNGALPVLGFVVVAGMVQIIATRIRARSAPRQGNPPVKQRVSQV